MFKLFTKASVVKTTPESNYQKNERSFAGAVKSRFTNWIYASFKKFSVDTKQDLRNLITRTRELAKNNEVFRSHLNNMVKSIIGQQGFRLQSLVKNEDGTLNDEVNRELERAWWDFGKRLNGYITKNGLLSDIDLDSLILRTLIIDGEVFIRINKDIKNPYGISFTVIDSLQIDTTKNQLAVPRTECCCGRC